jgi:hypothetical protein
LATSCRIAGPGARFEKALEKRSRREKGEATAWKKL